ncbi:MAG: hydrogenase [Oceanospirillaceae bacterium]|jgi:cytochrome b|nr:hydrogenase [Oceanospirillaceae bacterium]
MTKVWDLPIRLYHWLQAIIVSALLITGLADMGDSEWHYNLGFTLVWLLLWRIAWGFVGSETARFENFIPSKTRLLNYLRGHQVDYVGHNPAGALMVIGLLLLLAIQLTTGLIGAGVLDTLITVQDGFYDTVAEVHEATANLLMILIGLHISAILIYKMRGYALTKAMFNGTQRKVQWTPKMASNLWALVILLATAGLVFAVWLYNAGQ